MVDDRCDNIANWSNIWEDGSCTFDVIASWQGRSLVIEAHDVEATGSCGGFQIFASSQPNGDIYFYMGSNDVSDQTILYFMSGGGVAGGLCFASENIYYWDGAWHVIQGVVDNTWYKIKIAFECGDGGHDGLAADHYNVYINDIEVVSDASFQAGKDTIDRILFRTLTATTNDAYLDWLHYSWDPTGWSHKINGVANASINKVNGILKSNISKVNGVA